MTLTEKNFVCYLLNPVSFVMEYQNSLPNWTYIRGGNGILEMNLTRVKIPWSGPNYHPLIV